MTYGNGLTSTDKFNNRLQPSELILAQNGTNRVDLQYLYTGCESANNGNICAISDTVTPGHSQSFTYDQLNRITTGVETDQAFNQSYAIDSWGNMNQMGGTGALTFNNARNHIDGYCYDSSGNLWDEGPCSNPHTYAYDAEGHLITTTNTQASPPATLGTYTYDANGNRVRKDASGTYTEYVYFGGEPVAEFNSASGWTDYIFAGPKRIAQISASGAKTYFWTDHLGSTRVTSDDSGNLQCNALSTPFGSEVATCSNTHYKFTGKERDSETGLDYFGARYYGSTMGRWMSPDPINLTRARLLNPSNTLNKYAYGANNPLKYIDRDGEDITIFYRPPTGASGDYGHIMLGALNQATGKVAFLDYYPAGKVNGLGQGPGAFNTGTMGERAQQNADGKFATLTIQTSPEQAQKVINLIEALKNGSAPDYSALTNNCTTVCEDVLHDLGLDFGDVLPSSYWADVYYNFSADAQSHPIWTRMLGTQSTPGNEYGNPRNFPGVNNFSQWLFQLYMNQQQQHQPKACVEAHDDKGNSTGTQCE